GNGPRHQRWVPGAFYAGEGGGAFVSIFTGDIVGRLNGVATAAYGEEGTPRGASLRGTWRHPRPAIELGLHGFWQDPSAGHNPQPQSDSLDALLLQAVLAVSADRQGEGWYVRARAGAVSGQLEPTLGPGYSRRLAFGELALRLQQQSGAAGLIERMRVHVSHGRTRSDYSRAVGAVDIETTGRDVLPIR